jgi:exosortase/archaeosortase family protein
MPIERSSIREIFILCIKTLGIYAVLSVFFYGYIGITSVDGDYYSPFLAKYSLIDFLLKGLIYPVKFILTLAGYNVVTYQNNIHFINEPGIFILHGCLGLDIMKAYMALILGYPGRKKIVFLFTGLLFIHVLNIIRMLLILISIKTNPSIVIQSHDLLNIAGYICILIFYIFYIRRFSKKNIPV